VLVPGAPDPALAPNRRHRRGGFYAGVEAAREARSLTGSVARVAFAYVPEPRPFAGPVRVAAVIAWPKGRRALDWDSAIGCLKPYVDGLVDAGWLADDRQVRGIEVEQRRADPGDRSGWVELTVTAEQDAGDAEAAPR
jgi:hypothetical protein